MKNITMKLDESTGILTITIDTTARFGQSKSGKTTIVASTSGNVPIAEDSPIKIGINCYTK